VAAEVDLRTGLTPAVRVGPYGTVAAAVVALVVANLGGGRRRRDAF
jgi:apolipoprotein N-acyltransferase